MAALTKFSGGEYVPRVPGVPGRPYVRTCPLPPCYGGVNESPGVNCQLFDAPGGREPPAGIGTSGSPAGAECRYISVYTGPTTPPLLIWVC